jgi:hypothetical protein
LLRNKEGQEIFTQIFNRLSAFGLLGKRERSRTASTEVLRVVCTLSSLEELAQAMCLALEALAAGCPKWLGAIAQPHWYERYGDPSKHFKPAAEPSDMEAFALAIGADGFYLLKAISESGAPELEHLLEVSALKQVWLEQYEQVEGKVSWRKKACTGSSLTGLLRNPIDQTNLIE